MSEFDDLLRQELLRTRKAEDVDYGPAPVTGLADTFAAGVRSTTKQLGADVEYFKALSNTIIGDDEAAARNIERARVKEEFAAAPVETIETFGRFLEEPTVSGFFTQLAKGTGQVLPYAVTSIVGAGTGAIATAVGRGVLTSTSRAAAKKLIQESAERVAKNQATPDEKALVQGAYEVLQGQRKAIVRGGLGGAGASEYVPMAASNLSEALEVGEELDRSTAFRAAGLAIPQAVIGVGGEAFLAKSLFNVATKRAAKVKTLDAAGNPIEVPDKSTMVGRLASDLSKSALRAGATGSSTEVVQEGIAVANRFDLDDEYTVQDAQLRLAEAAFMGFFGEGVLGAAGGVAAGGVRELTGPNRFREISEEVLTKSRNLVEQGRDRTVGRIFEEEQYGDMSSGFTTPEPESDINAQLNALTNDSSSKKAVWIEGGVPQQGATKDGQIQRAIVNGYAAYTAFIPGKGTIVSLNKNLVEAVIRDGASDKSLQLALGYSAVKDTTAEDQLVVQALDKDGNIISAELTAVDLNDPRSTALNAAVAAAEKLAPEGGDVSVVTVADALEARKKKLGPSIAEMQWTAENEREAAAATGADIGGPSLEQEGELAQEALARLNEPRDEDTFIDYKARNPETDLYPNEWGAREAYENEFGVQDWDGEARFYSEGLIKRAVQLQEQNPDNDVFIGKTKEGKYRVISYNPDKDVELFDFKNEKGQTVEAKVSLKKFLQLAVAKATKGKFVKNSNVTLIPPEEGAKPFNVNLADLTFSGQRIIEQREGTFTGASAFGQRKKGFNAIINALLGAGYEIQFNGKSITEHTDAELRSINNVVGAVSETGSKIPVGRLLRGKKEDRAYDETFLESTASPIGGSPRPAITRDETDLDIEGGPVRDARSRTGWSISFEGASQIQQEKEREAGKTDEEAFGKEEFEMTPASAGETARVVYDPEKESPQLKVRPQGSEAQSDQTPYRGRTTATTGPELTEAGRAEAEAAATRRREADAARRTGPTKATGKPTPRPRETTEEFNERVRAKAEAVAAEEEFRTEAENERRSNEEAEAEFITEAENERRSNEEARAEAEEDFDDPADFYEDIYEGVEGEEPLGVLLERELEEAYEETQKLLSDNFGIDNPAVVGFIKALVSLANFKKPPYILSETLAREILENGEKNRYFLYEVLEDIKAGLARLDGPEGAVGVAVPVQIEEGRTVIILKSGLNNPLAETGVALHEVGHAIYNDLFHELLNKAPDILERLTETFKKHPKYESYLRITREENANGVLVDDFSTAFNEWFADQVVKYASKRFVNKKPKNITDKVFMDFVGNLRRFWRQARKELRPLLLVERLGKKRGENPLDQDFETFLDAAIERRKIGQALSPDMWVEKKLVKEINEATKKQMGPQLEQAVNFLKRLSDRIINGEEIAPIYKLLAGADSYMRRVANNKIADVFHVRSQQARSARDASSASVLGMIGELRQSREKLNNLFIDMVGEASDPYVIDALREASSDKNDQELSALAQQVRAFYREVYDTYIEPSNSNIKKAKNYSPIVLDLEKIAQDPDAFIDLILTETGQLNDPKARALVRRTVAEIIEQDDGVLDQLGESVWRVNPQRTIEKQRVLTAGVDPQKLTNFLRPAEEAHAEYVKNLTRRVEWNRHTKDEGGRDILGPMLEELTPDKRDETRQIIEVYLGYQKSPMSPFWRDVNSWGQVVQFVTLIPFAVLASQTEFAGPMIASKDFASMVYGLKNTVADLAKKQGRVQAETFARDLGIIGAETVGTIFLSEADRQFMTEGARSASDAFFKYTGLTFFTRFTRVFAANMAVNFVIRHSDPATMTNDSLAYLDELGLTPEEVRAWADSGRDMTTDVGKKVGAGISRFVESSILRPNVAERPLWASDPRFALVWQLKAFFWSYGKVIMGGVAREAKRRIDAGETVAAGYTATAALLSLAAVVTLPLAMLGMELREYAKYGLAWLLPGVESSNKYFRSDRMDWPTYMGEIIDRSGMYGPFTMVMMMQQQAEWGRSPLSPALGPTAEMVETIARNGFDVGKTLRRRIIPIYNQL